MRLCVIFCNKFIYIMYFMKLLIENIFFKIYNNINVSYWINIINNNLRLRDNLCQHDEIFILIEHYILG